MSRCKSKPNNEDRCAMSDLRHAECDHCRSKKRRSKKAPVVEVVVPVLNDVVVAEYDGTCQVCVDDIIKGDHIGWIDEVKVKDPDATDGHRMAKRWAHYGCGV